MSKPLRSLWNFAQAKIRSERKFSMKPSEIKDLNDIFRQYPIVTQKMGYALLGAHQLGKVEELARWVQEWCAEQKRIITIAEKGRGK